MVKNYKSFLKESYYEDDYDEYGSDDDYEIDDNHFYYETFGEYDGDNIFYHASTDKHLKGTNGIHIGTYKAAKQALEARIGVPANGEWDGTRKYSETLLAGKKRIKELEKNKIYCGTGYNCGSDVPDDDYLPTDRTTRAKYSDSTEISLDSYPIIFKVKVIGDMEEEIISDDKANDLGNNSHTDTGYYYSNIAEDEGSISAVVPTKKWLKIL